MYVFIAKDVVYLSVQRSVCSVTFHSIVTLHLSSTMLVISSNQLVQVGVSCPVKLGSYPPL